MSSYTPQSVSDNGVVTATDDYGNVHHFHTDPVEAQQFLSAVTALSAGREELGLLLYSGSTPEYAQLRYQDGRSDSELRSDWLLKVTACGMPEEQALQFLNARLAC